MATTYVVQFEITSGTGEGSESAERRVHDHLAAWTTRQIGRTVSLSDFSIPQRIEPTTSEVSRALVENVHWDIKGTSDVRALHYELSLRPVAGDSRKLTTVVTTLRTKKNLFLRIAFEEVNELLSPAKNLSIYPPLFLHNEAYSGDLKEE